MSVMIIMIEVFFINWQCFAFPLAIVFFFHLKGDRLVCLRILGGLHNSRLVCLGTPLTDSFELIGGIKPRSRFQDDGSPDLSSSSFPAPKRKTSKSSFFASLSFFFTMIINHWQRSNLSQLLFHLGVFALLGLGDCSELLWNNVQSTTITIATTVTTVITLIITTTVETCNILWYSVLSSSSDRWDRPETKDVKKSIKRSGIEIYLGLTHWVRSCASAGAELSWSAPRVQIQRYRTLYSYTMYIIHIYTHILCVILCK